MSRTVHRICNRDYASDIWSGNGGLVFESRWLPAGFRVIYTAESQALAILEYTVQDRFFKHTDVVVAEAHLPATLHIEQVDPGTLDPSWSSADRTLSTPACRPTGLQWMQGKHSAVLRVPSSVSPGEWNYLLNVTHPDFGQIECHEPKPLALDPRLVGNRA